MEHTHDLRRLGGKNILFVGLSGEVGQEQILVLDSGQRLSPRLVGVTGFAQKLKVFITVRAKVNPGRAMVQVVSYVHRGFTASTLLILAVQDGKALVEGGLRACLG